jgi:4-hydroxy-2-oxoheptanedioate aldolase
MLRTNFLKATLDRGDSVIGTWAIMPSIVTADVIAATGIDFLVIDEEHGPIGFETAQAMAIACDSRGVSPVIRVGGVIEAEILRALDVGAHAIHVPNVKAAEDARRIVGFAKYPPAGDRGFSPFTRAGGYSAANSEWLTSEANDNTLVCIHIEGSDAVERIGSFLEVEGIDIVFVGLYDLSKSMGLPGQVDHPDVLAKLDECIDAIRSAGKVPGTIANTPAQMRTMLERGVRYLTYSVDCEMLGRPYREAAETFFAATGRARDAR